MNENGEVEQMNDYYPSGALMGSSTGGAVQRYKYNGKELDRMNGLDWYDYGARKYDAAIVRWNGLDKLAEKDYPHTAYGYCANNFMNAVDPDGKRIVIWYKNKQGNMLHYNFNGLDSNVPVKNSFVKEFVNAYNYNVKNGGGKSMKYAAFSEKDFNLYSSEDLNINDTYYQNNGRNNKYIVWEPRKGLLLTDGKRQSPATRLEHEFDHYVDDVNNHKVHKDRANIKNKQYDNEEEKRVVEGNEADTARKNGEGIRKNHKGKTFKTKNSTSIY